ncbi:YdiY family protein [Nibricoccus sp. IMCC34717]|uniref:DUF481 domain-containing protein n=1 Tax=Nibricoccus sp. IMCC34717 TaxID=3034021 RepID=UPI00384AE75A
MNRLTPLQALGAITLVAAAASSTWADVIETKSGARITGKVKSIDGTTIVVATDFAGDIKVKQSEVVSLTTDAPLNIRLASGTTLQGVIKPEGEKAIQITGSDGAVTTSVDKVAATWAPGAKDPAVASLERTWAYEAAVDVTGKTGNKEQLGTAFSFRATLATAQDTLQFYSAYDRQITDGTKSADQFKAGVDYANNFSGKYSWYARDEGGFDRVKNIQLFNVAAAGFGYDVIKEANHMLTFRAGLAFRYEGYATTGNEALKSAGLDFGLNHKYVFDFGTLVNRLTYVPTFEDFSNYRATHESYLELPLAAADWKVRLGISNDYNSKPTPGVDKLDTTYFTRLVLNWK